MPKNKAHNRRVYNWNKSHIGESWRSVDGCQIDEKTITYIIGVGMLVIVCMVIAITEL